MALPSSGGLPGHVRNDSGGRVGSSSAEDNESHAGVFQQALRGHATFRLVALVLGFAFQITIVKVLSPENYATYAILLAALMVGERLLSFGTDRTVLRFVPALMLSRDMSGLRFLVARLVSLRVIGIVLFLTALTGSAVLHARITPSALSVTTILGFGVWFLAYTLLKEADAVSQSLILHYRAAVVAASEVVVRIVGLSWVYVHFGTVNVTTVVVLYGISCTTATGALLYNIWWSTKRDATSIQSTSVSQNEAAGTVRQQLPIFAIAAYASTLSFLISSPGVIRLVARAGLDVYALAAFSFVQGLATSLSTALPGQLVLPSLEAIAAKMTDSGGRDRIYPVLSLLFKIELTCVLSIIIVTATAGEDLISLLSRHSYAPYYYILPVLMVGLLFQTIYRLIEIIGSANLRYRIFLAMWPLSALAIVALYLTVRAWGLAAVLIIPLVEIFIRIAILTFAFRKYGIWSALNPARSLRIVAGAIIVLGGSLYVAREYGHAFGYARIIIALAAVLLFLSTLLILRPLSARERDVLANLLPTSWAVPRNIIHRLSAGYATAAM